MHLLEPFLAFLAVVCTGYLLICQPSVQINVSAGAPAALTGVAASTLLGARHVRGRRKYTPLRGGEAEADRRPHPGTTPAASLAAARDETGKVPL